MVTHYPPDGRPLVLVRPAWVAGMDYSVACMFRLKRTTKTTAYVTHPYLVGELAYPLDLIEILPGVPTPYDTGARAEPKVWDVDVPTHSPLKPMPEAARLDRYGKVDFDDSAGDTIATVWIEGTKDATSVLHIMQHQDVHAVVVHLNDNLSHPDIELID